MHTSQLMGNKDNTLQHPLFLDEQAMQNSLGITDIPERKKLHLLANIG